MDLTSANSSEISDRPIDSNNHYSCGICLARATGYHFEAQSCSACAAFFRRAIVHRKHFKCKTGLDKCSIHYTLRQVCQACRLRKCFAVGMNKHSVQPKKSEAECHRLFATKSGLKRNKRFGGRLESFSHSEFSSPQTTQSTSSPPSSLTGSVYNDDKSQHTSDICGNGDDLLLMHCDNNNSVIENNNYTVGNDQRLLRADCDVLRRLIAEELKIGERRRILFCERPVGSILGRSQPCPYTAEEIFPLRFRKFRKSIRTHILLVYEWLRSWPVYDSLDKLDQITFLRKCVLYHTILDPSYITLQIGYPKRFVMQNGGYVAVDENCKEGWEDEKEISSATKQKIYRPLLRQLMSEIVEPMVAMKISLEEFVALKAFVSWKGTMCEISADSKCAVGRMLDALCISFHRYYEQNNRSELSERFGNIILLLSSVFATGLQFVESHHEVAFFDLWQLDSLLVQLLKCESD